MLYLTAQRNQSVVSAGLAAPRRVAGEVLIAPANDRTGAQACFSNAAKTDGLINKRQPTWREAVC